MYAIINPIEPFDAAIGTIISFTWNGNQIFKVRCQVKLNSSGETVYDETVSTMKKEFQIPAGSSLNNGEYYVAVITVFDEDGNESDEQNIATPFYCFTIPTFLLSVKDGDTIKTSEYSFNLRYEQTEQEELNSYEISLYSYQKTLLQTTSTQYDTTDMKTTFTGLNDATEYYVRATGTTLHGMLLDTGFKKIIVAYKKKYLMSVIEANNMADVGGIEVRSNIVSIEGVSKKPVIYLGDGGADLTDNNITFSNGFLIDGDFTQIYAIKNPKLNQSIIHFQNENADCMIDVYYREGSYASSNGYSAYFELQASYGGQVQISMSNYVSVPSDNQRFVLYIVRTGCYYDLHLAVINDEEVVE